MPLPSVRLYGAKICQRLSKRTKLPCNNPAAFGSRACRLHGAHKSHARLAGSNHPNFQHGNETKEARAERRQMSLMFQRLEEIGWHIGLFAEGSTKTRGKKVGKKLNLARKNELVQAILESSKSFELES